MVFDQGVRRLLPLDAAMVDFLGEMYRASRYLESASVEELHKRLGGLIAAILRYSPDGTPNFIIPNSVHGMTFLDLREEFAIRNLDIDTTIAIQLSELTGVITEREIRILTELAERYRGQKVLFKFLKKEHGDFLIDGSIRFSSAASYNDGNLPAAIHDDELEIQHKLKGLTMTTQSGQVIPIEGGRISSKAVGPYFVSCFTANCRIQYFPLFAATCCVVIPDSTQFVQRVLGEYQRRYPGDTILFSQVEYIDAFRRLKSNAPIEFRKSSVYEFEDEWRFAAWSQGSTDPTDRIRTIKINPKGLNIEKFELGARI